MNILSKTINRIGWLDLTNGFVDITDPCYDKDVWCALWHIAIKSGKYLCRTFKFDLKEWGARVMVAQIVHQNYIDSLDEKAWEKIGDVGVDAGLMSFSEDKQEFDDTQWQKFCDNLPTTIEKIYKNAQKPIFVTSSGIGDGYYPVFAQKDGEQIIAIEVRFWEHPFLEEELK